MLLGNGVCPVPRLRSEGITIALGTDGAASNDNQDMFGVIKTTGLLHKVNTMDPTVIQALARCSRWPRSRARGRFGIDDVTGSLEAGKRADVVLLDGNTPELATIHDPWQQIVYCATARCVSDVWIDGHRRVADGAVPEVDVPDLAREARERGADLVRRAGLGAESSTPATGGRSATGPPADAGLRDAVVIGAGHNGLACGSYLARAGLDTVVLEQAAPEPGGCIVTEQLPERRRAARARRLRAQRHPRQRRRRGPRPELAVRASNGCSPTSSFAARPLRRRRRPRPPQLAEADLEGSAAVLGREGEAEGYRRSRAGGRGWTQVLSQANNGPPPTMRELTALADVTLGAEGQAADPGPLRLLLHLPAVPPISAILACAACSSIGPRILSNRLTTPAPAPGR